MSKKFIAFILVLLVVMFAVQYRMPKRFVWEETYLHTDRQPFGCYVFDSLVSAAMPKGYTVTKQTLWQLNQDSLKDHAVIVSMPKHFWMDEEHTGQVLALAARGNRVLVCNSWSDELADTLRISVLYNHDIPMGDFGSDKRVNVQWATDGEALPLKAQFEQRYMNCSDSAVYHPYCYVGGSHANEHCLVVGCRVGQGEVLLCTAPILLTNYAMLNDETRRHATRLLGLLKDRPVIRTEALLTPKASQQESPFYLLLERPPLRWALNLTLLTVLLFVVFTARRRQRVIPVVTAPENHNMDFVRLIGTLYYQQNSNRDLLRMKVTYAAEEIRRRTGTDPDENEAFMEVRKVAERQEGLTEEELKYWIDQLNEIINKL